MHPDELGDEYEYIAELWEVGAGSDSEIEDYIRETRKSEKSEENFAVRELTGSVYESWPNE